MNMVTVVRAASVRFAGVTRHPDQEWMEQIARSPTQATWSYLSPCRFIMHDRDTKFCATFRTTLDGGVSHSVSGEKSKLNAFAERRVRSAKQECLLKLILFGEGTLSRTLAEFSAHYHGEGNHQGKDNKLRFPAAGDIPQSTANLSSVATAWEACSSIMDAPHE